MVHAENMSDACIYDVVHVGPERLLGEVMRVEGNVAAIQVHSFTAGLVTMMMMVRGGGGG